MRTLPLTQATVERYADVRAALTSSGIAKSDFDLLIACTALEQGALRAADLVHAWAYASAHPEEIAEAIRQNEAA